MHGKGAVVKNLPASAGDLRDMVRSLGQDDPLEKEMATHSVFLPGKFNGHRSLAGYSPLDHKESDMTEHAHTCINNQSFLCCNHSIIFRKECRDLVKVN